MLRSTLFPEPFAGNPQLLVDEARRLVKQRLARPRQVEALRREILSATGASISAEVLTGFVGQADGRRPRNHNDRHTLLTAHTPCQTLFLPRPTLPIPLLP